MVNGNDEGIMKKKYYLSVIVLLFMSFVIGIVMIFPLKRTSIQSDKAILSYHYLDKNISMELSQDESIKLKNILTNKRLYSDNPSCGFTKEISIRFHEQVFCIACDSCPVIKLEGENKYFNISESDRKEIEIIFERYGGIFPCIWM